MEMKDLKDASHPEYIKAAEKREFARARLLDQAGDLFRQKLLAQERGDTAAATEIQRRIRGLYSQLGEL
jgi:hypothetical protein